MEQGVSYSPAPAPQDITPNQTRPVPQNRLNSKIVLAVLGVTVVLGLIIFFATRNNQSSPSVSEITPTPTTSQFEAIISPSPTPVQQMIIKPGWMAYLDPNDNFTIQYPKEFSLAPYEENTFKGILLSLNKPASSASASAEIILKIIYLNNSAKNAKQFASDQAKLENIDTITPSMFKEFSSLELPLKGEWGRGKIIFFEKGSTVYRISYIIAAPLNFVSEYEATLNQILASFQIPVPDPNRGK